MIRCSNGHYYDENKYTSCPNCGINAVSEDNELTVKLKGNEQIHFSGILRKRKDEKDEAITVNYTKYLQKEKNYVTSWLVCISGPEKGRDYRIFNGNNFVGRDESMDIRLESDLKISRKKHCSIIYDEKSNKSYIRPMENNVYINNNALSEAVELKSGMEITLGESTFVFIPFCEGERKWEKEN